MKLMNPQLHFLSLKNSVYQPSLNTVIFWMAADTLMMGNGIGATDQCVFCSLACTQCCLISPTVKGSRAWPTTTIRGKKVREGDYSNFYFIRLGSSPPFYQHFFASLLHCFLVLSHVDALHACWHLRKMLCSHTLPDLVLMKLLLAFACLRHLWC